MLDAHSISPNNVQLELHLGDITKSGLDAIVTEANAELAGGGGVDGAVHTAAGSELLATIRALGGCETGSAVITEGFELSSRGTRWVIHAVGPIWNGGVYNEEKLLRAAYTRSLDLAVDVGASSVAFPAISAGVYGYPLEQAATVAVESVAARLRGKTGDIRKVAFFLFDEGTLNHFQSALEDVV